MVDPKLQSRINTGWTDPLSTTPEVSKEKHQFWLSRSSLDNRGVSIRALENPEVFASIFPGYAEADQDKDLWKFYFQRVVKSQMLWSPVFIEHGKSDMPIISNSWLGNIEIFKRFGANLIILGNSQTYRSLVPDVISRSLTKRPNERAKVLLLTTGGMTLDEIEETSELLTHAKKRADFAVIGFSPAAVLGYKAPSKTVNQIELERYRDGLPAGAKFQAKGWPTFRWEQLFRLRLSDALYIDRKKWEFIVDNNYDLGRGIKMDGPLIRVPIDVHKTTTPEMIVATALKTLHENKPPLMITCAPDQVLQQMNQVIRHLLVAAKRVLIFVVPPFPLASAQLPDCVPSAIKTIMAELAKNGQVDVLNEKIDYYGLTYSDFLHENSEPGTVIIDSSHTNYNGAVKVSRALARALSELTTR